MGHIKSIVKEFRWLADAAGARGDLRKAEKRLAELQPGRSSSDPTGCEHFLDAKPEVIFRYYTSRYSQPIPAALPVVFT